jgi:TolB-like protein/Flp pilus assembly protein TadD
MLSEWFSEIRRRNVHRVLLAYLAGSWLTAQVTDLLSEAFGWPAWALRAIILLLLAGLPVALFVAWFFALTPSGLVREDELPAGTTLRSRSRRGVDVAIAALVAAALGYFTATHDWTQGEPQRAPTDGAARLAVLPFKPLLAAGRDEALELGMADTLITRLSGLAGVIVSPLSSVRRFGALEQDPLAAGRDLGVGVVLDGSVQRNGERFRVTARLLDVADGRQLWSARFDERYTDVFAVQDSIAERVAAALALQLTPAEHDRLRRRPTEDTVAYDLFLKGRYFWNRRGDPENLSKAIDYYRKAVARDADFALAWSGLADAQAVVGVFGIQAPADVYPEALQHAERALRLDPSLAAAHATRGHIRLVYLHEWEAAFEDYETAIQFDPRYAQAYMWRGFWLCFVGRCEEGVASLETARSLEPDSLAMSVQLARVLFWARRYEQAAEIIAGVLEIDPGNSLAAILQCEVDVRMGRFDEALARLRDLNVSAPGGRSLLGVTLALAGRTAEARAELAYRIESASTKYVSAYDIASIHAALGDTDQAFAWLDRAFEERSALLHSLRIDPVMDAIRGDPRYAAAERRLNLPSL